MTQCQLTDKSADIKNKIQEHLETGELWRLSFTEEVCIQSAPERSQRNDCCDIMRVPIPQSWSIIYKAVANVSLDLCTEDMNCGTFRYFPSGLLHLVL